ncbi:hypothetical protein AB1E18_009724 [Capra hircus]
MESGNGGLRRTRARHERDRREGSWVKSGRAAPGERGEEPGSEVRALEPRLQSPPRERSEQEEPFCFRPRQHAPLLTELLFPGRWREELHPGSPNPTPPPPSTTNTLPNSTLPLNSLPSPPYRPCNNALRKPGNNCLRVLRISVWLKQPIEAADMVNIFIKETPWLLKNSTLYIWICTSRQSLEISVYSFNHTDVSIFGRTRKHTNAWAAFML